MKYSKEFFTGGLTALILATRAFAGQTWSYDQVAQYLKEQSHGVITPAPGSWTDLTFVPENSSRWNKRFLPTLLTEEAVTRSQDAFKIDVEAFIRRMDGKDFMESKWLWYAMEDFNVDRQTHDRPYYYQYSWGSLFHPPIKKLTLAPEIYSTDFKTQEVDTRKSVYFDPEFQREIDSLTDTQLTMGNKFKLLPNGTAFDQKLRLIREAKSYLFSSSLVYVCDESTHLLVDEMEKAVKRGVHVTVLVERVASLLDFGCNKLMRSKGVDVLVITDILNPGSHFGVMHNKLWIRDGEEAILGGENVLAAENRSTGFNFKNRDTDVLVKEGPLVTDLAMEYIGLWQGLMKFGKNESLASYLPPLKAKAAQELAAKQRGRKNYEEWLKNPETRMNGICRLAVQPSGADTHPISPIIYEYMDQAQSSVFFNSPTIEYSDDTSVGETEQWNDLLKDLIIKKSNHDGVKFNIISNGFETGNGEIAIMARELFQKYQVEGNVILAKLFQRIEYSLSKSASASNRAKLMDISRLNRDINTFQYMGYNHAKTYVFDRLAVAIGSYNFDLYSSERSYETQMFCLDKGLLKEVEDQFLLDLVNSIPITSANFR